MSTVRRSLRVPVEYTDPRDELLSRFVKDMDGRPKGETIGTEGDRIIIMEGGNFYMLQITSIALEGKVVRIKKTVNWKRAKALGDHWRNRKFDPL